MAEGEREGEPWGESCVCTNSGAVVEKGFALRGRVRGKERANADRNASLLYREFTEGIVTLATGLV